MGYLAVEMAMAYLEGVTSIPTHIPTGYIVMNRDNVDKPEVGCVHLHQVFAVSTRGLPPPKAAANLQAVKIQLFAII